MCMHDLAFPSNAGYLNDLYRYIPGNNTWKAFYPSQRELMGFTATSDGMIYVFGGLTDGNDHNLSDS